MAMLACIIQEVLEVGVMLLMKETIAQGLICFDEGNPCVI